MSSDMRVPPSHLEIKDDAELAWRVIEPAWGAVNIYDGPEPLAADLATLSPGQRALLAMHWCVSEVMNGGFDQFLTNPSGLLAGEAVHGFALVGAVESEALLRQAIDIFAARPTSPDLSNPDFDEAADAEAFDAYRARHAPLEDRLYELVETEIYPRAAAYVRSHPEQFVHQAPAA
jgi:hypothetical protein